jgi:phage baseplate assembly protein gpV
VTSNTTADLSLRIFVDGIPLPPDVSQAVRRIEVESQVNLPSSCEMEFADPELTIPLECGLEIGAFVQVRAVLGNDPVGSCIFFGRVESLEIQYENVGGKVSVVRAYDEGHRMMHGQKSTGYPLMTYSELAEVVGAEYGIVTLATPHPVLHQMIVQSNETAWDFLVRLGREIGYVVFVEVDPVLGNSTLIFGPAMPAESAPPPTGIEVSPLSFGIGDERVISVQAFVSGSGITSTASARGWDQTLGMPSVGESPTASETTLNSILPEELGLSLGGAGQYVNFRNLYGNEAEVESASFGLSTRMAGAYSNIEIQMRGNPSAMPNRALGLSDAGVLTGEYTITTTTHTFVPDLYGYRTAVVCSGSEDRTLAGLQDAAEVDDKFYGVYPAIVTDVEDPEMLGRVLLSFPWLSENYVSPWARVVQAGAGAMLGMQILPEPTDEVLVAFENAQLDSPYVLGGLYSQERQAPIPFSEVVQGTPMIRAYTSRDGHQVIFNDSPENTSLTINTTRGASCMIRLSPETGIEILTIEEQPIVITSASDITLNSEGEVLVNSASVTINGEADVSISAEGALEISAVGALNLAATTVNIEADAELTVAAPIVNVSGGIVNLGA